MVTLTVTDAYCTVGEADAYLVNHTGWQAAEDETKTEALLSARYYIDTNWSCDLSSYDVVPDELKFANAALAGDYIADASAFDEKPIVKRERVKADTVESETEFSGGNSQQPPSLTKAKGALQSICTKSGGSVFLLRA